MNHSPLGRPALYCTYTGREQCCVLLRLSIICVLTKSRLRVVPHFSSGIVEQAKRERAWKSPHARKGDTRRSFTQKKRILIYFICYTASSGCETHGLCELLYVNVWFHVRRTARSTLSPSHRVLFGLVQVVIRLPSKTTVLIKSVPVNTQA